MNNDEDEIVLAADSYSIDDLPTQLRGAEGKGSSWKDRVKIDVNAASSMNIVGFNDMVERVNASLDNNTGSSITETAEVQDKVRDRFKEISVDSAIAAGSDPNATQNNKNALLGINTVNDSLSEGTLDVNGVSINLADTNIASILPTGLSNLNDLNLISLKVKTVSSRHLKSKDYSSKNGAISEEEDEDSLSDSINEEEGNTTRKARKSTKIPGTELTPRNALSQTSMAHVFGFSYNHFINSKNDNMARFGSLFSDINKVEDFKNTSSVYFGISQVGKLLCKASKIPTLKVSKKGTSKDKVISGVITGNLAVSEVVTLGNKIESNNQDETVDDNLANASDKGVPTLADKSIFTALCNKLKNQKYNIPGYIEVDFNTSDSDNNLQSAYNKIISTESTLDLKHTFGKVVYPELYSLKIFVRGKLNKEGNPSIIFSDKGTSNGFFNLIRLYGKNGSFQPVFITGYFSIIAISKEEVSSLSNGKLGDKLNGVNGDSILSSIGDSIMEQATVSSDKTPSASSADVGMINAPIDIPTEKEIINNYENSKDHTLQDTKRYETAKSRLELTKPYIAKSIDGTINVVDYVDRRWEFDLYCTKYRLPKNLNSCDVRHDPSLKNLLKPEGLVNMPFNASDYYGKIVYTDMVNKIIYYYSNFGYLSKKFFNRDSELTKSNIAALSLTKSNSVLYNNYFEDSKKMTISDSKVPSFGTSPYGTGMLFDIKLLTYGFYNTREAKELVRENRILYSILTSYRSYYTFFDENQFGTFYEEDPYGFNIANRSIDDLISGSNANETDKDTGSDSEYIFRLHDEDGNTLQEKDIPSEDLIWYNKNKNLFAEHGSLTNELVRKRLNLFDSIVKSYAGDDGERAKYNMSLYFPKLEKIDLKEAIAIYDKVKRIYLLKMSGGLSEEEAEKSRELRLSGINKFVDSLQNIVNKIKENCDFLRRLQEDRYNYILSDILVDNDVVEWKNYRDIINNPSVRIAISSDIIRKFPKLKALVDDYVEFFSGFSSTISIPHADTYIAPKGVGGAEYTPSLYDNCLSVYYTNTDNPAAFNLSTGERSINLAFSDIMNSINCLRIQDRIVNAQNDGTLEDTEELVKNAKEADEAIANPKLEDIKKLESELGSFENKNQMAFAHQIKALTIASKSNTASFDIRMGGGKSFIEVVDGIRLIKSGIKLSSGDTVACRPLYVMPANIIDNWITDVRKFFGKRVNIFILRNSTENTSINKTKFGDLNALIHAMSKAPANTLYVCSYEWLRGGQKVKMSLGSSGKYETLFSRPEALLQVPITAVYFDECHLLRHKNSSISNACRMLASVPVKRILTGTMQPKSAEDPFGQCQIIDPMMLGTMEAFNLRFKHQGSLVPGASLVIRDTLRKQGVVQIDRSAWTASLPKKVEEFYSVNPSEAMLAVYNMMLGKMVKIGEDVAGTAGLESAMQNVQDRMFSSEDTSDINSDESSETSKIISGKNNSDSDSDADDDDEDYQTEAENLATKGAGGNLKNIKVDKNCISNATGVLTAFIMMMQTFLQEPEKFNPEAFLKRNLQGPDSKKIYASIKDELDEINAALNMDELKKNNPKDDAVVEIINKHGVPNLKKNIGKIIVMHENPDGVVHLYDMLRRRLGPGYNVGVSMSRANADLISRDKDDRRRDFEATRNKFSDENDPINVLVVSEKTATLGLNLQAADLIIKGSIPWNPSDYTQSNARAYRLGNKFPAVHIYTLVMDKTLEWTKVLALIVKESEAAQVSGTFISPYYIDSSVTRAMYRPKMLAKYNTRDSLKELPVVPINYQNVSVSRLNGMPGEKPLDLDFLDITKQATEEAIEGKETKTIDAITDIHDRIYDYELFHAFGSHITRLTSSGKTEFDRQGNPIIDYDKFDKAKECKFSKSEIEDTNNVCDTAVYSRLGINSSESVNNDGKDSIVAAIVPTDDNGNKVEANGILDTSGFTAMFNADTNEEPATNKAVSLKKVEENIRGNQYQFIKNTASEIDKYFKEFNSLIDQGISQAGITDSVDIAIVKSLITGQEPEASVKLPAKSPDDDKSIQDKNIEFSLRRYVMIASNTPNVIKAYNNAINQLDKLFVPTKESPLKKLSQLPVGSGKKWINLSSSLVLSNSLTVRKFVEIVGNNYLNWNPKVKYNNSNSIQQGLCDIINQRILSEAAIAEDVFSLAKKAVDTKITGDNDIINIVNTEDIKENNTVVPAIQTASEDNLAIVDKAIKEVKNIVDSSKEEKKEESPIEVKITDQKENPKTNENIYLSVTLTLDSSNKKLANGNILHTGDWDVMLAFPMGQLNTNSATKALARDLLSNKIPEMKSAGINGKFKNFAADESMEYISKKINNYSAFNKLIDNICDDCDEKGIKLQFHGSISLLEKIYQLKSGNKMHYFGDDDVDLAEEKEATASVNTNSSYLSFYLLDGSVYMYGSTTDKVCASVFRKNGMRPFNIIGAIYHNVKGTSGNVLKEHLTYLMQNYNIINEESFCYSFNEMMKYLHLSIKVKPDINNKGRILIK